MQSAKHNLTNAQIAQS